MTSSLILRHQPLKLIYNTYVIATYLFLRLPLWASIALIPRLRPRASWTYRDTLRIKSLNLLFATVFKTASWKAWCTDARSFSPDRAGLVWIEADPALIVGDVADLAAKNKVGVVKVPAYWYGQKDAGTGKVGQVAAPDEVVVIAFHSGGFIVGDTSPASSSAMMYRDVVKNIAQVNRVLGVDYRIAQPSPLPVENPFPAALMDAITAYNYLVNDLGFRPSNIILFGESAGGHIAVMLARYLIQADLPTLPRPGGVFLLSPFLEWTDSHTTPSSSMEYNRKSDWVEGFLTGHCGNALLGHLPPETLRTNWWLSPASRYLPIEEYENKFKDFPPVIFFAGDAEMGLDAMETLAKRMRTDMGDSLTYHRIPDGTHIPLVLPGHELSKRFVYPRLQTWFDLHFTDRVDPVVR